MKKPISLSRAGTSLALLFAALIIYFAGSQALNFILLILTFLFTGELVTRYGAERKRELTLYEYERDWQNVLSNGLVPTLCAALYASTPRGFGAYIGSLSAITADKFSSEIGVLGSEPYLLSTFARVRHGTNGAVSLMGTLASWSGGIVLGTAKYILYPGTTFFEVLAISAVGFAGSFADSLAGILENRGIGNKATTNIIGSLVGALLGYYLL